MTVEAFENVLREYVRREPFVPFVVEMLDGRQIVVPHRHVAFGGGGAAFLSPDDEMVEFVCEDVKSMRPIVQGAAA